MREQTLRELIKQVFEKDLPISGGFGSSIVDAIVIELANGGVGVDMEYQVLEYLRILNRTPNWKVEKQELLGHDNKHYDKLSIIYSDNAAYRHNYYFDISKFFDLKQPL